MKKLQNRIAESRRTMPWASLVTLVVWMAAGAYNKASVALSLALLALAVYLTIALNNRYTLMRIYSRMASTMLMAMACSMLAMLTTVNGLTGMAVACLFLLSYRMLFDAYQDKSAKGMVYAAYACIGIASWAEPQVLLFVPILWIMLKTKVMALSAKTFTASLLGLLTPYWLGVTVVLLTSNTERLLPWWMDRATAFGPIADFSEWPLWLFVATGLVYLFFIVGSLHFMNASNNESIKTRMLFHIIMTIGATAALWLILQPQQVHWLLPLLMVHTSFVIGHCFTFTRTRLFSLFFLFSAAATLVLTLCNLWMLS